MGHSAVVVHSLCLPAIAVFSGTLYHSLRPTANPNIFTAVQRGMLEPPTCTGIEFVETNVTIELQPDSGIAQVSVDTTDGEASLPLPTGRFVNIFGTSDDVRCRQTWTDNGYELVADQCQSPPSVQATIRRVLNEEEVDSFALMNPTNESPIAATFLSLQSIRFFVDTNLQRAYTFYINDELSPDFFFLAIVAVTNLETGVTTYSLVLNQDSRSPSFGTANLNWHQCCGGPGMRVFEDVQMIDLNPGAECPAQMFLSYNTEGAVGLFSGSGLIALGADTGVEGFFAIESTTSNGNLVGPTRLRRGNAPGLDRLPPSDDGNTAYSLVHNMSVAQYFSEDDCEGFVGPIYFAPPQGVPRLEADQVWLDVVDVETGVLQQTYTLKLEQQALCFAGSSQVLVQGEMRRISELQLGDLVLVDPETNRYEAVYSFGHYQPNGNASFLEIHTTNGPLVISKDHLVMMLPSRQFVAASQLQPGDLLHSWNPAVIESIHTISAVGVYAPFTPSGTIVVDGIVASTFVSLLQDEESSWITTLLRSHEHELYHAFELPHRVVCRVAKSFCRNETYTADGMSTWVATPYKVAQWILKQREHNMLCRILFLLLILLLVVLFLVEQAVGNPGAWVVLVLLLSYYSWRSRRRLRRVGKRN